MHPQLSRREFLKASALGAGVAGMTLADWPTAQAASGKDINCILLFLVGGPSQLETFDPKPDAPSHVRGPFGAIRTRVPGVHLSETLPLLAEHMDKVAIVRSVHHTAAPIHETGQQLLQTGRLVSNGVEPPHYGAVLSYLKGQRSPQTAPFALIPGPITNTGVSVGHGQTAGHLGALFEPAGYHPSQRFASLERDDLASESSSISERYGANAFGGNCQRAVRLIEQGARFVTVNMFDTVFDKITWDCHADGGSLASTLGDYRRTLCPMFDQAYTALLDDLEQRGMLDTTLVLAMGEFGRTPVLNPRGGRDHWSGCWSVLFAGAGIRGGQVIGSSDAWAGEPKDRPVNPAQIAATVYTALGLNPKHLIPGPDGQPIPLADAEPIRELLA